MKQQNEMLSRVAIQLTGTAYGCGASALVCRPTPGNLGMIGVCCLCQSEASYHRDKSVSTRLIGLPPFELGYRMINTPGGERRFNGFLVGIGIPHPQTATVTRTGESLQNLYTDFATGKHDDGGENDYQLYNQSVALGLHRQIWRSAGEAE